MIQKWQRWSREELAILKEHFLSMSRDGIMQLLPSRTWRAICHQASKQNLHRPHYGTVRSDKYLAMLHTTLSIARANRTSGYAPFAGKHHSADAKLAISVSNLYTRFHCVADIAALHGITEKEVRDIIERRDKNDKTT